MPVDREISADLVEAEVGGAADLAAIYCWDLEFYRETLELRAKLSGPDEEVFLLRGQFDDYRELPPKWTFLDPDDGTAGTPAAFPRANGGGQSQVFIDSNRGPVICLPCNRLAYAQYQGPHGDWPLQGWESIAPCYPRIPEMLLRIQTELSHRKGYQGRRAPRRQKDGSS